MKRRRDFRGTLYQERKWAGLLRATAHVAPYFPGRSFINSSRLNDAMSVIRAYTKDQAQIIPRSLHERLATDKRIDSLGGRRVAA